MNRFVGKFQGTIHKFNQWRQRHNRHFIYAVPVLIIVICLGFFWILPTYFGKLPGDIGYSAKRLNQSIRLFLTPGGEPKNSLELRYADRRIEEAGELLAKGSTDAATYRSLFAEYVEAANKSSGYYSDAVNQHGMPTADVAQTKSRAAKSLVAMQDLHQKVPSGSQASILQALDADFNLVATTQDVGQEVPITQMDGESLSSLIAQGFLTREQMDNLLSGVTSNRVLLARLRDMASRGEIPSSALYDIFFDVVASEDGQELDELKANLVFDEMRRLAIFLEINQLSATDAAGDNEFVSSYQLGDPIFPRDGDRKYVVPALYGLNLVSDLPEALDKLPVEEFAPDRKVFADAWKKLLSKSGVDDLRSAYNSVLILAREGIVRDTDFLRREHQEIVLAAQNDVVYLALPPGWTIYDAGLASDFFNRYIDGYTEASPVEKSATQLSTELADASQPLALSINNQQIDVIRNDLLRQFTATQVQIINQITQNPSQTDQAVIIAIIAKLEQDMNLALAGVQQTNANTDALNTLRASVQKSLDGLKKAQSTMNQFGQGLTNLRQYVVDSDKSLAADIDATGQRLTDKLHDFAQQNNSQQAQQAQNQVSKLQVTVKKQNGVIQTQIDGVNTDISNIYQLLLTNSVDVNNQLAVLTNELNNAATDRAQLQQAIDSLKASQVLSFVYLTRSVSALDNQVKQSVAELNNKIQLLETAVAANDASLQSLTSTMTQLETDLAATDAYVQAQLNSQQNFNAQLTLAIQRIDSNQAAVNQKIIQIQTDTLDLQSATQSIYLEQKSVISDVSNLFSQFAFLDNALNQHIQDEQTRYLQLKVDLTQHVDQKVAVLEQEFRYYKQQIDVRVTNLETDVVTQDQQLQQKIQLLEDRIKVLEQTNPSPSNPNPSNPSPSGPGNSGGAPGQNKP